MPMVRAMRMLNAVEAGTLSGSELEALLTSDPGRKAELDVLLGMRGQTRRLAASSTAMNAVAASSTAMDAVIASSTAMNAVAASSTAMDAVAASSTAMNVVAASSTAMNAVAASSTAMNAVAASSTAMDAVIASSTAMDAVAASSTAMNVVAASSTALAAVSANSTTRSLFFASTAVPTISNPTMTGYTSPSGIASASSERDASYPAWKAFDGVNTGQGWHPTVGSVASYIGAWVAYEFVDDIVLKEAIVGKTIDANAPTGVCIDAWDGSTWVQVSADTPTPSLSTTLYTIPATKLIKSKKFRMRITAQTASWCHVAEVKFTGLQVA